MANLEAQHNIIPVRRFGFGTAGAFLAGVVLWAAAFYSGAWPWLGYAWLERQSFGAGPVAIVGEDKAGTEFGLSTFLFVKGQTIVIDYDADIRAGSLWFYVYDITQSGQGRGGSHYVTESGSGVWTYPIPKTGLYKISIGPSVARGERRGHDLNYRVWWGARWER